MRKEVQDAVPNILIELARSLGTEIINRRLEIPAKFGKGYCAGYIFNEYIRMIVSNYELNEEIAVENPDVNLSDRIIFFKFQNIFPQTEIFRQGKPVDITPSVIIATSRINIDDVISIHSNTATINIYVDADYLNGLVDLSEKSPVLNSLLQNTQHLLFEQIIYPSIHKIVDEIVTEPVDETFELFFLRVKAEELICRLLMELEKRDEKRLYSLNSKDIQTIYKVKERMLADFENPPLLMNWRLMPV